MGTDTDFQPAIPEGQPTDAGGFACDLRAGAVEEIGDLPALLSDSERIAETIARITAGDVFVVKRAVAPERIAEVKRYLANVGRNSLPAYYPIETGCPNNHRINDDDPRAYVRGCFHQFSFFPWNQDVFNLFATMRDIYALRNRLVGHPAERFVGRAAEANCIARLSFQFYPAGRGQLNLHRDPVGHHQLSVPLLTMSDRGRDYRQGGGYALTADGTRMYTDEISEVGDFVLVNAHVPHGVELVDPGTPPDWLAFQGRWTMLAGVNKLHGGDGVADAVDLQEP